MFKFLKYKRPINFDGQVVPLHSFADRRDLIGKIITITLSSREKDQINVDSEYMIGKSTQRIYARRQEEIFAKIINVRHGYQLTVELIGNPLLANDSNIIFYIHDTRSTPYFDHSTCISKFIHDNVSMSSDLLAYFISMDYSDDFVKRTDVDTTWIDQSFLDRIDTTPTKSDTERLAILLKKGIIDQELFDKYINCYVPLNNIYETIEGVLCARKYMKYETNPYYPEFHRHRDCIEKRYGSYGFDKNNHASRYLTKNQIIHINVENIHHLPLELNHLDYLKQYKYAFGKIEKPMTFGGRVYEDRDAVLALLRIGNIVRCVFRKQLIDEGSSELSGSVLYFHIICIVGDTIYGFLKDFYYNPEEFGLHEGDIMVFDKSNITEAPRDWPENSNLKDLRLSNVEYFLTGCVCTVDGGEKEQAVSQPPSDQTQLRLDHNEC